MDSVRAVLEEIADFSVEVAPTVRQALETPGGDVTIRTAIHRLAQLLMLAKCLRDDQVAECAFEDAVFSGLENLIASSATISIVEAAIALDTSTIDDIDLCAPAEVITRRKAFILRMVRNGC